MPVTVVHSMNQRAATGIRHSATLHNKKHDDRTVISNF